MPDPNTTAAMAPPTSDPNATAPMAPVAPGPPTQPLWTTPAGGEQAAEASQTETQLQPLRPWRPAGQRGAVGGRDAAGRPPPEGAGSNRALLVAAGGAAVLVIVAVGLLVGGVFSSGSSGSGASGTAGSRGSSSSKQAVASDTTAHRTSSSTSPQTSSTTPTTAGSTGSSTAAGSGTTAAAPPAAGGTSPPTTTFTGSAFSIKYPTGWVVTSDQRRFSWGTDTTIVSPADPQTLLRVDVTPHLKTHDPLAAARAEISHVSNEPGYQQLALAGNTAGGSRGEVWEFLVSENGALLHKVDQFIVTPNGEGMAILTQAPAAKYGAIANQFSALRATISPS